MSSFAIGPNPCSCGGEYGDHTPTCPNRVISREEVTELGWKSAVIDALVVGWHYKAEHDHDPRKAVADLLRGEVQLSLDPRVSEPAAKLRDTYLHSPKGKDDDKVSKDFTDEDLAAVVEVVESPLEPCKSVDILRVLNDGLAVQLPQEPGEYLWYISDWGYLAVGAVNVHKDPEKHKAWLREARPVVAYIYKNAAGDELTMYHQADDYKPPLDKDNRPCVDGYIRFTMDCVNDRMVDWFNIWKDRYPQTRIGERPRVARPKIREGDANDI